MIFKTIEEAFNFISILFPSDNSVIFFDIDDTLIYNETNTLIQPVFNFYQYIKFLGIKPVIITARSGFRENINYTKNQLQNLGITDYKFLFFRDPYDTDLYKYKMSCRKLIHDMGFIPVMSIGDMPWDIGAYGGQSVLLK